ncbi:MAG: dephospho-CoA kinase [Devosia sp.]
MWKIGLTGSIATGKSTALRAFADLGVPVFSSDEAVHALYRGEAVAPIERLFPGVARDGAIDRQELARRLVERPERLKEVEAVVHPLVRNQIAYFFKTAEGRGAPLAVADIPLLFEGGFDYGLDAIVVTTVNEATQRRRALRRPGMTVEKLETVLARQLPQAEKQRRATYVLDTVVPVGETRAQVRVLVDELKSRPQGHR